MKSARRRIEVNLDELERVLDGARQAPLSEADYDKLKGALHALAAMLARPRNTEKTSAVVENPEGSETGAGSQPDTNTPPSPGHGRNGAEAFAGARKVDIAHQNLKHGDRCPECGKGNVYGRRSRRRWSGSWDRRLWRPRFTRWSGCAAAPAGRCSPLKSRKAWAEKYDETAAAMIAQLKYGSGTPFYRLEQLEGTTGDSVTGGDPVEDCGRGCGVGPTGA